MQATSKANLAICRKQSPHAPFGHRRLRTGITIAALAGSLPHKQEAMVRAWALIHSDELAAVWELAEIEGETFKIDPLR